MNAGNPQHAGPARGQIKAATGNTFAVESPHTGVSGHGAPETFGKAICRMVAASG
jgi:hypothetical protein